MSQLAVILSITSILMSCASIGLNLWWDNYEKKEREQFPYLAQDNQEVR